MTSKRKTAFSRLRCSQVNLSSVQARASAVRTLWVHWDGACPEGVRPVAPWTEGVLLPGILPALL